MPQPTRSGHPWRRAFGAVWGATVVAATAFVVVGGAPPGPAAAAGRSVVVGTTPVALTQPSDPGLGRLTPTASAPEVGMFGTRLAWPSIPIHASLLADGSLLTYGGALGAAAQEGLNFDQWNPAAGAFAPAHTNTGSVHGYNSFCNGLAELPDGRYVMVGGNSTTSSMVFDPATGAQTVGAALNQQRWYASVLRRPDGRVLVLGGGDYYEFDAYLTPNDQSTVAETPEIGTGTGPWTQLTGATNVLAFGADGGAYWYPRAYNAADGSVVGVSYDRVWRMTTAGTGATAITGRLPFPIAVSGSSAMYAPGRVLFAGGGEPANGAYGDTVAATNRAAVVDFTNPAAPVVRETGAMTGRRHWHNLTVLPTGEVYANGGTGIGQTRNPVYAGEIWNPATGTWRPAASNGRIRTYHSVSALLPSGAVFTGGGGAPGPEQNLDAELWYPPNLFTRDGAGRVVWAARPQITSLGGDLRNGGSVTLGVTPAAAGRTVASVSLISAANVTHSYNADQRRVPLTVTAATAGSVTVSIPASADTVPPGTYLLSVVDSAGVPSASQMVVLRTGAAGRVTVYDVPGGGGSRGVPLAPGTVVGLEPVNFAGHRVRTAGDVVRIDPVGPASSAADRADSSFVVRPGLASAAGVSLESVSRPGLYLRSEAGQLRPRANDGSAGFAADATFRPDPGTAAVGTTLALWRDPALLVRHTGFVLYTQPNDGSAVFRADSSFNVVAGLASTGGPPTSGGVNVAGQATPSADYTAPWNRVAAVNDGGGVFAGGLQTDLWGTWTPLPRPASRWLQYTWPAPVTVDRVAVDFWTDTATCGDGVATPSSWRLRYLDAGVWRDVPTPSGYPVVRGATNEVRFGAVTTTALRAVLTACVGASGTASAVGVSEWRVLTPVQTLVARQGSAVASADYTAPWNRVGAVNDGLTVYAGGAQTDLWGTWTAPPRPASRWLQYTWPAPVRVSRASLDFWTDTTVCGDGVATPSSWRLQYLDGTAWRDVPSSSGYPVVRGAPSETTFGPVTTTALRAVLATCGASATGPWSAVGVSEWRVFGPSA